MVAPGQAGLCVPVTPEAIGPKTLLGVCTSLKPAPGLHARSATRAILGYALESVAGAYPQVAFIDLRDHPLPLFDGRLPQDHDDAVVQFIHGCVGRAGALLLAVPAYWNGVSGIFKNFVDVLCGPAYEMLTSPMTVFTEKVVGLVVVGADARSSEAGARHAQEILSSTGAILVGEPVIVANPRAGTVDVEALSCQVVALAGEVARRAGGRRA